MTTTPIFFARPADFRRWLEANHDSATELLVGFHRVGSGTPGITWPEAVREALCFGWIDGVRRKLDDTRYVIRFTPRRPASIWSAVNVAHMAELLAAGRVQPAGLRAWERRTGARTEVYAYEQARDAALEPEMEREFRANAAAWAWFSARPPSYRRTAVWRIVSAKKPETRAKRLAELIACSAEGRTIPGLTR